MNRWFHYKEQNRRAYIVSEVDDVMSVTISQTLYTSYLHVFAHADLNDLHL